MPTPKKDLPRPNWDGPAIPNSRFAKYRRNASDDWHDLSGEDRLHLSPDVIDGFRRNGLALQWIAESCLGQELTYDLSRYERGGWQRLDQEDLPDHPVEVGGLRLYVRPIEIHEKAKAHEHRVAAENVKIKEQGLLSGDIPGIRLDSRHPSARRSNKINRSFEAISIPED